MLLKNKIIIPVLLFFLSLSFSVIIPVHPAFASNSFSFILLSQYEASTDIGDQLCLFAITSNGKHPTWKSNNSKVAAVNTYGVVTAKKAGVAVITAKIKNAEASCCVTVHKTIVTLHSTSACIERGETLKLSATTSNGSAVTWNSNKKSIATVDEYGNVTGRKPGEAIITAKADGSSAAFYLTVKFPKVTLNQSKVCLYRGQTAMLSATVSSNVNPNWKINKKSIAIIDPTGRVTAIKHGTATVTATVDGVSKTCEVVVQPPEIILSTTDLQIKKGDSTTVTASVSSNQSPSWSTSNSNIITINSKGEVKALRKGTAYIYASEDGTKAKCTVKVVD